MPVRVVFLDRDGTINVDHGYVFRVTDWQFTQRAPEALRRLRRSGFRLGLVTNQSGVARGYYRLEDVHALHAHMQGLLSPVSGELDALALCPHGSDANCRCRKPHVGMADEIARQLGETIDYTASWTIGDKLADAQFGWTLGTRVALIRSTYWEPAQLDRKPDLCVSSLYEAACQIEAAACHDAPPS
ncbi:MAG: D-glycero-alpha-D-manno-heptose-1,7-bisphosphate 7-phosphatase [Pirellulaceae bacterium]